MERNPRFVVGTPRMCLELSSLVFSPCPVLIFSLAVCVIVKASPVARLEYECCGIVGENAVLNNYAPVHTMQLSSARRENLAVLNYGLEKELAIIGGFLIC